MAALRRQLLALQNDPNLSQFILRDATPTGKQLGVGSYGSVEEIKVGGLVCAGKTIHEALLDAENDGAENIAQKYVQECQLMASLRHPNVTLFLGLCFLPPATLPVLVMERLEGSLDDLLETAPNIPLALKRSILEDVARGLLYLHRRDPPIIHRDLTAKNVLLTSSFAAKITDLGNSRFVNLQPGQLARTLSRLPGTLTYMSPEALSMASRYGPSLDIFSFGHLSLFTGIQVFPGDLLEHNFPDPENPGRLVGRTEVERREVYFERLENLFPTRDQHPFVRLAKQCIHNIPGERPTTEVLLRTLEEMRAEIEGPYGSYDLVKQDLMRQVTVTRTLRQSENEVRRKDREIRTLQQESQQIQERLQNELNQAQREQRQSDRLRRETEERVSRLQEQLRELEISQGGLRADLRDKETALQDREAQLRAKDTDLQDKEAQLRAKDTDLQDREAQLRAKDRELLEKNADISRLQRELQSCRAQMQRMENAQLTRVKTVETPLSQLKHPLRLKWRRGKDMPVGIEQYPRVVVIGSKVYIGGGDPRTVMVYDIHDDEMKTLPPLDYVWYGMTAHHSQLTVVGGKHHSTYKETNELCVWDSQRNIWTHPYPPMTILCSQSSVISYDRFILVAGGSGEDGKYISAVQVLDTSNSQWYQTTPLPEPCIELTPCIIGNVVYLLGGWIRSRDVSTLNKQVLSASLDELISSAVSPSTGATSSPWSRLKDLPVELSTALALQGSLLAVGGMKSSAIHAYQPSTKSWVKIGELSGEQNRCGCTILPNGELLVAGGYYKEKEKRFYSSEHDRIDIATIEFP